MPPINLGAPINVSDLTLQRVQNRLDQPLSQLAQSPWGSGVQVNNLPLTSFDGTQTISVKHNLGRAVSSVILLSSPVPASSPHNVVVTSPNTCTFDITVASAPDKGDTLTVWVF